MRFESRTTSRPRGRYRAFNIMEVDAVLYASILVQLESNATLRRNLGKEARECRRGVGGCHQANHEKGRYGRIRQEAGRATTEASVCCTLKRGERGHGARWKGRGDTHLVTHEWNLLHARYPLRLKSLRGGGCLFALPYSCKLQFEGCNSPVRFLLFPLLATDKVRIATTKKEATYSSILANNSSFSSRCLRCSSVSSGLTGRSGSSGIASSSAA
jgi:hypothetical protein